MSKSKSVPYAIHVCDFHTPPMPGAECREALWSDGRECRVLCPVVACYRHGWKVAEVREDMIARVREKTGLEHV